MKHQDGRKALVVFSDGEDRGSKDTLNDAIDAADRSNVVIYTIYFKGSEERSSGFAIREADIAAVWATPAGAAIPEEAVTPAAVAIAAANRSPLWTVRKSCSRSPRAPEATLTRPRNAKTLAPSTNSSPTSCVASTCSPYTPDKVDNDGGYHKIALKANKGDLQVSTREGYFAPGAEESK